MIDAFLPDMAAQQYCKERYPRDDFPESYDDVIVESPDGKQERFNVVVESRPHFVSYRQIKVTNAEADV